MLFKEGKKHTVLKLTGATIQETVNPFITAITLNCITILHINHVTGAALPFREKAKKLKKKHSEHNFPAGGSV